MRYENKNLNALARIMGTIEDPRGEQGKQHKLLHIFILAIYGALWGHTDFTNMAKELKYKEDYFTELLGLENGIPSHDTFSAVFSIINPEEFLECFISWITFITRTKGGHVALDGKAVRAACDKIHRGKVPYLVNAYLAGAGLCIGQIRIDEKTNEIKGIPEMIKWLDLEGATVTIDAIGCQKEIVHLLLEKGADFVLPVKENQPNLHQDILLEMERIKKEKAEEEERFKKSREGGYRIETPLANVFSSYEEIGRDHSRIEHRKYYVYHAPECIDPKEWEHVESLGMIIRERQEIHKDEEGNILEEEATKEVSTYIMSRKMEAEEFACIARGHWGVEGFHWVLDDCFREDRCTTRKGHAMENYALMRKIVYDLMKLDENVKKESMKGKQVYYRNNLEAIQKLIFEEIPSKY